MMRDEPQHLTDILTQALHRFGDQPINIIETGTIRGASEASRVGDGWSTLCFAEHQARHQRLGAFTSIDLDISAADAVLQTHGVRDYVDLVEAYSITVLAQLLSTDPHGYDVILLDSDNDAQLILHECLIAQQLCRRGGIIVIDDVRMPHQPVGAFKGDLVWPFIKQRGLAHHVVERTGWNGYRTGVLILEP